MMMTARMGSPSGPSWPPTPGLSTPEASGHWRSSSLTVLRSLDTSLTGPCFFTAPRRLPTPAFLCQTLILNWRLSRKLTRIERKCKIKPPAQKMINPATAERTSLNKRKDWKRAKNNLNVQPTSAFVVCNTNTSITTKKGTNPFQLLIQSERSKLQTYQIRAFLIKVTKFNNPTTRLLNFQIWFYQLFWVFKEKRPTFFQLK